MNKTLLHKFLKAALALFIAIGWSLNNGTFLNDMIASIIILVALTSIWFIFRDSKDLQYIKDSFSSKAPFFYKTSILLIKIVIFWLFIFSGLLIIGHIADGGYILSNSGDLEFGDLNLDLDLDLGL